MRKATRISLALGTSAALLSLSALPASAADDEGTTFAAEVPTGELAISTASYAGVAPLIFTPGQQTSFTVPAVTVTDSRAGTESWSVSVSLTNFVTEDDSDDKMISTVGAMYSPLTTVLNSGVGTADPEGTIGTLGEGTTANGASGVVVAGEVVGNNEVSWTADLSVPVPDTALQGDYTAVLTHSVL